MANDNNFTINQDQMDAFAKAIAEGLGGNSRNSGKFSSSKFTESDMYDSFAKSQLSRREAELEIQNNISSILEERKKVEKELEEFNERKMEAVREIGEMSEEESERWDKEEEHLNFKIANLEENLKLQERINESIGDEKRYQEKIAEAMKKRKEQQVLYNKTQWNTLSTSEKILKVHSELKSATTSIVNVAKQLLEHWGKIDQSAADFSKTIGGNTETLNQLRSATNKLVVEGSLASKLGLDSSEMIKYQSEYAKTVGRNISLTNEQKISLGGINKLLGEGTATELASSLENFGLSLNQVDNIVTGIFNESTKKGIAASKVTELMKNNIKMAQDYTFQRGIEGLKAMAMKSAEIKMDMQQVASFADKVNTVSGAVQTAANLQVLGGAFAQFANPLQMLGESITDVEKLSDRYVNLFSQMGQWNNKTGQVEINPFDRIRMKAAAEAMGVDYSKTMEMVQLKAKRRNIEGTMGNAFGGDNNLKNLFVNTATFQNGKWGYAGKDGKFYNINQIRNNENNIQNEMMSVSQTQEQNVADILTQLRGWDDVVKGFQKQRQELIARIVEKTGFGPFAKGMMKYIGDSNLLLGASLAAQILIKITTKSIETMMKVKGGESAVGNTVTGSGKGWKNLSKGQKIGRIGGGLALGTAGTILGVVESNRREKGEEPTLWAPIMSGALSGAGVGLMAGGWGALAGGVIGAGIGVMNGIQARKAYEMQQREYDDGGFLGNIAMPSINMPSIAMPSVSNVTPHTSVKTGFPVLGTNVVLHNDEFVVNSTSTANNRPLLEAINATTGKMAPEAIINSLEPMGRIMKVSPTTTNNNTTINRSTAENVKVEPIDVKFSGTINLTGLDGTNVDISKKLLDNPQFIDAMTKLITKESIVWRNRGYNKTQYQPANNS